MWHRLMEEVEIFRISVGEYWSKRKGKPYVRVFNFGDTYMATASNGERTVYNCYGSTPEAAKEMALWRLRKSENLDVI